MRIALLALASFLAVAGVSVAQEAPSGGADACAPVAGSRPDYRACASAAAPGSPAQRWALINLGTEAYMAEDYAGAVRFYDQAEPSDGRRLYSDAGFHAYRADAYRRVGRNADALANAQTSWAILSGSPSAPPRVVELAGGQPIDAEVVFGLILPILKTANDPAFEPALAAYNSLPAADWISYANRAAVLDGLGDHTGALQANARALAEQPDQAPVLNTHCFVLAELGRGDEALPYCRRALVLAPDIAAVHDSYSLALAVAGQCTQSVEARAEARRLDPATLDYQQTIPCTPRTSAP